MANYDRGGEIKEHLCCMWMFQNIDREQRRKKKHLAYIWMKGIEQIH